MARPDGVPPQDFALSATCSPPGGPDVCLLPALLGVGRIAYLAVARATHRAALPPLGGRDPAPMLTRDDVTRWGKLHVVTTSA